MTSNYIVSLVCYMFILLNPLNDQVYQLEGKKGNRHWVLARADLMQNHLKACVNVDPSIHSAAAGLKDPSTSASSVLHEAQHGVPPLGPGFDTSSGIGTRYVHTTFMYS